MKMLRFVVAAVGLTTFIWLPIFTHVITDYRWVEWQITATILMLILGIIATAKVYWDISKERGVVELVALGWVTGLAPLWALLLTLALTQELSTPNAVMITLAACVSGMYVSSLFWRRKLPLLGDLR